MSVTLDAGDTPATPPGELRTTDGDEALHRLAAGLDSPMVIVIAVAPDGRRSGCLVGFWTQCSIDPPRVLACVSKANHTFPVATDAPVLAVHWLADDDRGLAELFGSETGDEIDKFERCSWRPGPAGVPVLDGVTGWVAGPVVGRFDVGDHVAFVIEPEAGADGDRSAGQLGFQSARIWSRGTRRSGSGLTGTRTRDSTRPTRANSRPRTKGFGSRESKQSPRMLLVAAL